MCGIIVTQASEGPGTRLDAIASRGPDGRQIKTSGRYTFGFVRLAIVAVGSEGDQPYEDEEVVVTFNGELYEWDRSFGSEVKWLAHLAKASRDFMHLLSGQYFIVVYYKRHDELVCFRDPCGIVPGYYTKQGELASERIHPKLREIPPGHSLRFVQGRFAGAEAYWKPALGFASLDTSQHAAMLHSAALRVRRHADVRVSFSLGGLDSMTLLRSLLHGDGEAGPWTPDEVITVGLKGSQVDLEYARRFADHYDLDLHEVVAEEDDVRQNILPVLSLRLGEDVAQNPVKCWGGIRAALVARAARNKVILCGDGADELFYGYPFFRELQEPNLAWRGLSALRSMHAINLDRTDRAGMIYSKEYRPIYLERRYMEWVLGHRRDIGKPQLRALAKHIGIPDNLIERPKWSSDEAIAVQLFSARPKGY